MAVSALRPRSVTEIVDAAFQILRAHYAQFVVAATIAQLPMLVVRLVVIGDPSQFLESGGASAPLGAASSSFIAVVVAYLTYALMDAMVIAAASRAYLGETVDIGDVVRTVARRSPFVLLASLSTLFFLTVGFMALILPVLWVAARCFAVMPAVILENAGITRAFSRSAELSSGRKRHILNTLGLAVIVYWIVSLGVAMLGAIFGNFIVTTLLGTLVTILIYPVIGITETLLYYDARIQSEGLDIEMMTADLGLPATALPR